MPGNQLRQDVRPWYQKINDAARYYLGPAYEPIEMAGNAFAALSPGADMIDMQQESDKLMRSHGGWDTVNAGLGLAGATMGMAIPGTAKGISEGVDEAAKGIRAYHGSPHDFDQFSMDKIGTGEGAQAYGHGLYFADQEDVAQGYRDGISGRQMGTGYANEIARSVLDANGGDHTAAAKQLRDEIKSYGDQMGRDQLNELDAAAQALEQGRDGFGHMYEVNINASPDDFLDWDKPLSEQSEKVRGAIEPTFGPKSAGMTGQDIHKRAAGFDPMVDVARKQGDTAEEMMPLVFPDASSEEIATAIRTARSTTPGDKIGSDILKSRGIPGIRYLDQGSRGPHIPAGVSDAAGDVVKYWLGQAGNDGNKAADMLLAHDPSATEVAGILRSQSWKPKETHNYVVFDPRMIEILRKYGILGAAGIGGAAYGNALRSDREKT
jgi:hypothetical protein